MWTGMHHPLLQGRWLTTVCSNLLALVLVLKECLQFRKKVHEDGICFIARCCGEAGSKNLLGEGFEILSDVGRV